MTQYSDAEKQSYIRESTLRADLLLVSCEANRQYEKLRDNDYRPDYKIGNLADLKRDIEGLNRSIKNFETGVSK